MNVEGIIGTFRLIESEYVGRVARVLDQMSGDPFQGNVKALQGQQWKGVFRRRLGDDRLIFMPDYTKRIVYILRILIRSGGTYR